MIFTETALGSDAFKLWRANLDPIGRGPNDRPRIAVLLIGDGRDETRAATLASFHEKVHDYRLRGVVQVDDRTHQLGFDGAIEAGWAALRARIAYARRQGHPDPFDYVLHLEEDWEFLRSVDVRELADVLNADPSVMQCALRREPVNEYEASHGGVIECWPDEYQPCIARTSIAHGTPYLRHRLCFTTNVCLYRRELVEAEAWPQGARSEDAMSRYLVGRGFAFAYLGERTDDVYLRHTGERQGVRY